MITSTQYFGASIVPPAIAENARVLLEKVNAFLEPFQGVVRMSSGYRSPEYNKKVRGAAKNSKHMAGRAVDIADYDGALARFTFLKAERLAELGLYCEDMRATKGWVHFQSVPPGSGNRFYIPTIAWAQKLGGKPLTLESLTY